MIAAAPILLTLKMDNALDMFQYLIIVVGLLCLTVGAIQLWRVRRQGVPFVTGADVRTERGRLDVYFTKHAIDALGNDPRFWWLYDEEKLKKGTSGDFKRDILSELGRFEDGDLLRFAAARICEMDPKPTTQKAIGKLREWRFEQSTEPTLQSIKTTLADAIDSYLYKYPTTGKNIIRKALREISDLVEDL